MEYESGQFGDGVSEAVRLVTELVIAKRGQCGGTQKAIRTVARDCSISAAYRRYLVNNLALLEADLRRLDAMGNIDPGTRIK